jgi:uncharacterized secreted protein with C-terminal beta-propeller domain
MIARPLIVAALVAAVAVPAGDAQAARKRVRLTAFSSCAGLIHYARSHAPKVMPVPMPVLDGGGRDDGAGGPRPAAPRAPAPVSEINGGQDDSSTTNVQEQGIDEPDVVKSDGSRVFAVAGGMLHAIDARASAPRLLRSLRLPDGWSHELLLHGERLLVVSHTAGGTLLTEVDASAMRVVHTLTVPGSFVSARLTGATARVVVSSSPPALELPRPLPGPLPPSPSIGIADALRSRPPASLRSRLAGWVPSAVLRTRRTGRVRKRALVSCRGVRHPARFSGLDILTVLTIDLDRGLPAVDADAIMSSGDTVYASTATLYVATPALDATAVHAFDASKPGSTSYRASGQVPGSLLNQFSLSEHGGVLRAATTTVEEGSSVSRVTTLAERSGRLAVLGHAGDLGRGERIYAVRFIGDAGYVVTFRQTDPLFTLDLSDPARPVKRGELELRGYSAYLHPIAENLLLGVGQDATAGGSTLGTQLSLFDVSDLAHPVRLHQRTIASGSASAAEYDHHAFLWWPKTSLAVLPLQTPEPMFSGAVGFRVERDGGIAEAGRVSHPGDSAVQRALVVGDRLVTLSDQGLMVGSADTLSPGAWLPLPSAER